MGSSKESKDFQDKEKILKQTLQYEGGKANNNLIDSIAIPDSKNNKVSPLKATLPLVLTEETLQRNNIVTPTKTFISDLKDERITTENPKNPYSASDESKDDCTPVVAKDSIKSGYSSKC